MIGKSRDYGLWKINPGNIMEKHMPNNKNSNNV